MKQPHDLFTTAQATGERLARTSVQPVPYTCDDNCPAVTIDRRVRYQRIEGFGGAFTESASTTLDKMPEARQEEILNAYFHPETGHRYSFCRTHINSCDFSLGNYAYTEVDGDVDLEHFSIARDLQSLIPMIRRARALAGDRLRLFASPWSPPAWMKTTGAMNRGGRLKPEYRATWAKYYARYIKEYAHIGIPIVGVTVQNEPAAVQAWDSCIYTAEEERDFVRDYLGPALAAGGLEHIKIIIWDHNRDLLFARAKTVLDDPAAAKFVWGIGFHWYVADCFENVALCHDAYPDKVLILTEACVERGPQIGLWSHGERYARSIVQDLNHWAAAWVDWNLLLDEQGGPNHVGNFCSAPIIADTKTGEIHYQSSYYYLGHFSRFIEPGAQRVLCASGADALEATSALNPDGSLATVILNRTDNPIAFRLVDSDTMLELTAPAHGILTVCSPPSPG
jgi:glucosylceramidase